MRSGYRAIGALAFVALMSAGASARAQDASDADLRCFVALAAATGTAQPELKTVLAAGALYFLGKLDGRTPGMDLEKRISEEADKMTPDSLRTELKRCGTELQDRGQVVEALGSRLSAKAQGETPPAPGK